MKSLENTISQFQNVMEHFQNQIFELHRQLITMVGDKAEVDKNINMDILDKEVKRTKTGVQVEVDLKNDPTPRHQHDVTFGASFEPSTKKEVQPFPAVERQEMSSKMCVGMENFDDDMSYHELEEMQKMSVNIEDTEELQMGNNYINRDWESEEETLLCRGRHCKLAREACLFLHRL
jgi:hypothetical protein